MLPKKERLSRPREIRETLHRKQYKFSTPLLQLVARENHLRNSRFLVIVKKAVGKAVKRNRTRRVLVTAYSNICHKIRKNVDIVVFPVKETVGLTVTDAGLILENLLSRAKLL